MKILVAADGSPYTLAATRWVAAQAKAIKGTTEIHLLHVHAPMPLVRGVSRKQVQEYQDDESRKALAVAEKELEKSGLGFTSSWCAGDPAEEVARYAKKNGIDIVVTGSRGHTGLASVALGSVAMKLIALCKVPVLVVPKT